MTATRKIYRRRQLLTRKQQIAAEAYVSGEDMTASYRKAYDTSRMKPQSVHVRASELFRLPHVAAYVAELSSKAAVNAIMSRQEAMETLTRIGRGRVSALLDEHGRASVEAIRASGPELEEYTVSEMSAGDPDGDMTIIKTKLKVRNPVQAIERLARMQGWDKPTEVDLGGVVFNLDLGGGVK